MKCFRCSKTPSELEEYSEPAKELGITPEEYVKEEEGTYNSKSDQFCCTPCYIAIGTPSGPYPYGWKAP